MAGHVAPEAAHGGPIAALREGDIVRFDIPARTLSVDLSDEELAARLSALTPVPPRVATGVMGKYARLVSSAARGAITAYGLGRSGSASGSGFGVRAGGKIARVRAHSRSACGPSEATKSNAEPQAGPRAESAWAWGPMKH